MGNFLRLGGAADRSMKLRALKASVLLSVLFLVVYHTCNWITSRRLDVGTIYFEWERVIPFVPFFILPYMSVDLFFVAAPFLCADEGELRALCRRIALAILAAGACFLLFPLQLAVERPQPDGWLGVVFRHFCEIDRPHNLLPSLHITLCCILAVHYGRHCSGVLRVASDVWFALIALSALLTYQHHFIDVVGGFVLAALCFYFVRETPAPSALTPNPRLGLFYALGAAGLCLAGVCFRPWGLILLWPAFATAMVAVAYFSAGPGIYRKENGRLPWSARLLLAPCLIGQWISLWHYQLGRGRRGEIENRQIAIGARTERCDLRKFRREIQHRRHAIADRGRRFHLIQSPTDEHATGNLIPRAALALIMPE